MKIDELEKTPDGSLLALDVADVKKELADISYNFGTWAVQEVVKAPLVRLIEAGELLPEKIIASVSPFVVARFLAENPDHLVHLLHNLAEIAADKTGTDGLQLRSRLSRASQRTTGWSPDDGGRECWTRYDFLRPGAWLGQARYEMVHRQPLNRHGYAPPPVGKTGWYAFLSRAGSPGLTEFEECVGGPFPSKEGGMGRVDECLNVHWTLG